jgi:hypothetical protein
MKYLKGFKLFEKTLEEAVEELKDFQKELDINSNITKLIKSVDGIELELGTIFENISGDEDIIEFEDDVNFNKELEERNLRISQLFDTEESATLIKLRLRYYWIYDKDSTELDTPIYVLLQWVNKDNTLSKIKLYYIQKDISNFYDELSTVKMIVKQKDKKSNKWIYISSNSGQNWVLQNTENATSTFKITLNSDDVEELSKHPDVIVDFE